MKKLFLIYVVVFLLMAAGILAVAHGDAMHPANQRTIVWDAATHATAYAVYVREDGGQDAVLLGETEQPQYTATLAGEGVYRVGVRSIRREMVGGVLTEVGQSDIVWSDDPLVCADGETFAVYYFLPPETVVNIVAR